MSGLRLRLVCLLHYFLLIEVLKQYCIFLSHLINVTQFIHRWLRNRSLEVFHLCANGSGNVRLCQLLTLRLCCCWLSGGNLVLNSIILGWALFLIDFSQFDEEILKVFLLLLLWWWNRFLLSGHFRNLLTFIVRSVACLVLGRDSWLLGCLGPHVSLLVKVIHRELLGAVVCFTWSFCCSENCRPLRFLFKFWLLLNYFLVLNS